MFSVANHELVKSAPILSGPNELREFPDWFRDQQHAAWKEFEGLPTPTRKDQAWRFSNVALLDLAPFKISAPLSEDDRKNGCLVDQIRFIRCLLRRFVPPKLARRRKPHGEGG